MQLQPEIDCKQKKQLPTFEEKHGSGDIEPSLKILAMLIAQQYLHGHREVDKKEVR